MDNILNLENEYRISTTLRLKGTEEGFNSLGHTIYSYLNVFL